MAKREESNNVFDLIQTIFGKGHEISILQEVIDVDMQLAYFDHLHLKGKILLPEELIEAEATLEREDIELEEVKDLLVCLAITPEVKAYRILEQFALKAKGNIRDWAVMAFQENRVHLETILGEQPQALISSGMGGVGHRLRYFVVMQPNDTSGFTPLQRDIIEKEVTYCLQKTDSLLEEMVNYEGFTCITVLIPLQVVLPDLFSEIIEACNLFGKFLSPHMIITNVKKLDEVEVRAAFAKGM